MNTEDTLKTLAIIIAEQLSKAHGYSRRSDLVYELAYGTSHTAWFYNHTLKALKEYLVVHDNWWIYVTTVESFNKRLQSLCWNGVKFNINPKELAEQYKKECLRTYKPFDDSCYRQLTQAA